MSKADIVTKEYIRNNRRFADLCNYYLFDGRGVIHPEDLTEKDISEITIPYANGNAIVMERLRDILKHCVVKNTKDTTYAIVGVENQTKIHYAMVIRNMLYDALNYTAQVKSYEEQHQEDGDLTGDEFLSGIKKTDKLTPVITIVVYWNSGEWDGPRTLYEMLDTDDKEILKYISNYSMNVVVPDEITKFNKFKTELGTVFNFIKNSDTKDRMQKFCMENTGKLVSLQAIDVLNICVNAGIKKDISKGDEQNMCKGMEEWLEEKHSEGVSQGISQGEELMSKLVVKLMQSGRTDELERAATDSEYRRQLFKEYELA